MKIKFSLPLTVFLLLAAVLGGYMAWASLGKVSLRTDEVLLLVPDDYSPGDPLFQVWLDGVEEEGFPVTVMKASDFVRGSLAKTLRPRGLIMPDSIHRSAGFPLVQELRGAVEQGARLLLVYDAAISASTGVIVRPNRLKSLAGVDYALYDTLGEHIAANGHVLVRRDSMAKIGFTPGRFRPVASSGFGANDNLADTYLYERAKFPHLITSEASSGLSLAYSGHSIIANLNKAGKGEVLFVNMPLGYLKHRTDAQWLHVFLRYFMKNLVQAPQLLTVPNGVGGLVVNWHIDNKFALEYAGLLDQVGFDRQGPFSIHLTAGPDTDNEGDARGMDLDHNKAMQEWVQLLMSRGHEIGSHGGWIHNFFAAKIDENSRQADAVYIDRNIASIQRVTQRPVREYSAPSGNHPQWVTDYAREKGIRAYYYTGNAGMGPTRSYLDKNRSSQRAWSFPVAHSGQIASFEEAARSGKSNQEIFEWLRDLTQFSIDERSLRLFYFHPIGVSFFKSATAQWLNLTAQLSGTDRFRFYTMAEHAKFLDRRQLTSWQYNQDSARQMHFKASNPQGLSDLAWRLPKNRFARPDLPKELPSASISEDPQDWILRVGNTSLTQFQFTARTLQ